MMEEKTEGECMTMNNMMFGSYEVQISSCCLFVLPAILDISEIKQFVLWKTLVLFATLHLFSRRVENVVLINVAVLLFTCKSYRISVCGRLSKGVPFSFQNIG